MLIFTWQLTRFGFLIKHETTKMPVSDAVTLKALVKYLNIVTNLSQLKIQSVNISLVFNKHSEVWLSPLWSSKSIRKTKESKSKKSYNCLKFNLENVSSTNSMVFF